MSHCDKLLADAALMLRPETLGISADRSQVADLLNQWLTDCGRNEALPPIGETAKTLLGPYLSAEAIAGLAETRFDGRDVDHIRTCLLLKQIGDHVVRGAESDRERVAALFDFTVRTVALAGEVEDPLPLSPFEVLLFGRGTAADRAWIFAELLRQLRIDAVIITPRARWTGTEIKPGPFLVGVLLDEPERPLVLFDPRLGWAVPAPNPASDSPLDQTPATLAEVLADPSLLARLTVEEGESYAFSADDLKEVHVELITHSAYCRLRMLVIQNALPSEKSALFFDPLDDEGDARGLLSRVVAFGGERWGRGDVSLWPHAERNVAGIETLDDRQAQRLLVRRHPFDAPASPVVRGKSIQEAEVRFTPKKLQWATRVAQLQGHPQAAVRSYLAVRVERDFDQLAQIKQGDQVFDLRGHVRPEIARMHYRAAEDATFWIGICQYDVGDFAAASQTLSEYLRRHEQGEWINHARGMLARSYARDGKYAAAIQTLNAIDPADPQRDGHRLLQKRLREQREKPGQ